MNKDIDAWKLRKGESGRLLHDIDHVWCEEVFVSIIVLKR